MNLYAFLLLTSTTAFLVSGETLDAQTTISRVQSPGPLRVVVSPSDEKRSLGASDISKSKMLEIVVYRRKVFKKWLDENHSSMEVFDFFKLGKKKYEMYRKLYNEYRIAPVLSEVLS
ncbi:60S ribosomal export protein NMD3 [Phytophthora cinnamomi]|uniref:60S ribosomal export protein NMD3 n=1 Tax=Phytophthora cinnamomi TaxID=4785 RepID=UPI003559D1E0|nr:60S ribosomal export protein NMD3 [Phytophthora cinnamomi]